MLMKMMGVVESKNTLRAVLLIACAGLVGIAQGAPLSPGQPYPIEPFVSISVPTKIDLGSIGQFGQQTFNSTIKAHIIANCPHHIEASIGAFANSDGGLIPMERTKVEMTPPLSSPIGTPVGGVDVNINLMFTIDIESGDPAGQYTGTLVLTVTAGP